MTSRKASKKTPKVARQHKDSAEISKKRSEAGKQGGRPKGTVTQKTIDKRKVEEAIKEKIMARADELIASHFAAALGVYVVYKKVRTNEWAIVKDEQEILNFLNGKSDPKQIYTITKQKPDVNAIDKLMDRAFGKPKQEVENTGTMKHEHSISEDSKKHIDAIFKDNT